MYAYYLIYLRNRTKFSLSIIKFLKKYQNFGILAKKEKIMPK